MNPLPIHSAPDIAPNTARSAVRRLAPLAVWFVTLFALPIAADPVTGIELGVEGSAAAIQGRPLRWFFTLYEIVGKDRFKLARDGVLHITTSLKPDEPADVETDRYGRAQVEIPVPEDAADFEVVIRAESGKFHRDFTLFVSVTSPNRIALIADRTQIQPGETVTFLGRILDGAWGRPLPGRAATITLTDHEGRRIGPQRTVTTDAAGTFSTTVTAPSDAGVLSCTVTADDLLPADADVRIDAQKAPALVVSVTPKSRIVRPGDTVPVTVTVRRKDGRPVAGATVRADEQTPQKKGEEKLETDRSGRAQFMWPIPATGTTGIQDRTQTVVVDRPGIGTVSTAVSVRVARDPYRVDLRAEGGALIPGLPSRIYARVVRADGAPAAGISIRIDGPLLGTLSSNTDGDGIARFDGRPKVQNGIEAQDRCGGITAAAVSLTLSEEAGETARRNVVSEHCIPVDPDGTVRVRPAAVEVHPGDKATVDLYVAPDAANLPLETALLLLDDTDPEYPALVPISRQIIADGGRHRKTAVAIPEALTGELLIRTRPLVGETRRPTRGGTARFFSRFGKPLAASVRLTEQNRAALFVSENKATTSRILLPVPASEAFELMERLTAQSRPALFHRISDESEPSERVLEFLSAGRTQRDDAAPAVLRNRTAVGIPAPSNPIQWGVLRDPIRARARFVRGRLALSIKTLEERLDNLPPSRIREIGLVTPQGNRFNREALSAVKESGYLQGRDPRTLGGDPLHLEDLEQADGSFTFDNMARRITRKRLFALLVHLRRFVRDRNLDLRAAGQDPTRWLDAMKTEAGDYGDEDTLYYGGDFALDRRHLYDGWGRRTAILKMRPNPTDAPKFISPLPNGYALVSAGPDGRFRTADDISDPFARVLPSGSIYAEAVGEDALLLRLRRIEIDKAVVDTLTALFGDDNHDDYYSDEPAFGGSDFAVEPAEPLPPLPDLPTAFVRPWIPISRKIQPMGADAAAGFVTSVDDEPRRWSLVAAAWDTNGRFAVAREDFDGGTPLLLDPSPLDRLVPDEALVLQVAGALLPGAAENPILSVSSEGPIRAAFEDGETEKAVFVGPGGGFEARIRLAAEAEGAGTVRIVARSGKDERVVTLPITAQRHGSLRKLYASAAVSAETTLRLPVPEDAVSATGDVAVVPPGALENDPTLARWFKEDPALIAWAIAITGKEPDGRLLRYLEAAGSRDGRTRGTLPLLSTACAAAAWSAAGESDTGFADASRSAVTRATEGTERSRFATDAAILAALSLASAPNDTTPLSQTLKAVRADLRESIRVYREDPAYLARAAAALLLVDRRDLRGRTMLALVAENLAPGYRGGRVVRLSSDADNGEGDPKTAERSGREQIVATAALAVAAHQIGEEGLARELAQGVAAEASQAARLGGEPLFWMLAARVFGVFGVLSPDEQPRVALSVNRGAPNETSSSEIPTRLFLAPISAGEEITIRAEPRGESTILPLLYTQATYRRPPVHESRGPLNFSMKGDPGFAGERAAFVGSVSNDGDETVEFPTALIALPAGSTLDDDAIFAMRRPETVLSVDRPDGSGTVRIRFTRLAPGETAELPLPIRWTAGGRRTGLSVALFPEDRDWALTTVPAIEIDVPFRP